MTGAPCSYLRSENSDGGYTAVCLACSETLGPCGSRFRLDQMEERHICAEWRLRVLALAVASLEPNVTPPSSL